MSCIDRSSASVRMSEVRLVRRHVGGPYVRQPTACHLRLSLGTVPTPRPAARGMAGYPRYGAPTCACVRKTRQQ
jgi:hypothetical protein